MVARKRGRGFGPKKPPGKAAARFMAQAYRADPATPREKEKAARTARLDALWKDPESIFDLLDEIK